MRAACFVKTYTCADERSRDAGSDYVAEFRSHGHPFRSAVAGIDIGGIRVTRTLDHGTLDMQGQWFDDAMGLAFVWGEKTEIVGRALRTPRPILAGVGTDITIRQRGWSRNYRVGFRHEVFANLLADPVTASMVEPWLRRGPQWPHASAAVEWQLQRAIGEAASFAERAASTGCAPTAAVRALADDALAALLRLLDDERPQSERPHRRERIVNEALEVLEAYPDEPVSVRCLCDRLGVSERTLERTFNERFGIGPRGYERQRRLRAVHGAILSHGRSRTVTEIAMEFGFWHLGRFAANYTALYGCQPSQSRRRVWGIDGDAIARAFPSPLAAHAG